MMFGVVSSLITTYKAQYDVQIILTYWDWCTTIQWSTNIKGVACKICSKLQKKNLDTFGQNGKLQLDNAKLHVCLFFLLKIIENQNNKRKKNNNNRGFQSLMVFLIDIFINSFRYTQTWVVFFL
jgi:hypothetical protein